jgi:trimeric autotransporter adhesin
MKLPALQILQPARALFFLLLLMSSRAWSQGAPACPAINAGTYTTVCQGACVQLTSTLVTNNQTTTYSVAAIPYAPYPFVGTQVLNGTDDLWSNVSPIGFDFCYFGTAYNQMVIGSNGQITFDATQAGGYNNWQITAALPNVIDMPGNTICGAFRDIDPSMGGDIYYQTVGSSPCRALVISWVNVPLFDVTFSCPGTSNSTFQIVLYENTNYIDVYIQNSSTCSGWTSGYGEIGIQDQTGTVAVVPPGRNFPATWTGVNEAWRFSPTGPPSYTVTWSDASGVVGTGQNVNVCPGATTTYTASMTLTNCTGSQLTVTDTVSIGITPGTAINVNSPTICAGSTATLTATGGTTYTWSANAGSATTASVTVSPTVTTVYTVTANGGGGGGCAPVATSTVTVVPSLSVTVNTPAAICAGASATLTATGAGTYTWTPATGLSATTGSTVTASPTVTTNYTVVGSAGSCAPATATTVVTIIPSSTITVNSATVCPTTSAILTANGSATYSWSPGTGLSQTSGSIVTANPAATTVYTVTGGNCVTPGTSTVTVVPSCSITVNSATICAGASATLTASGGGPYTWSPATGLSSTSGASVTASPAVTTVYTVTSSSGGFNTSSTSTVVVNPNPTVVASNTTICQGSSATVTATGASGYAWTPATGLSTTTGSVVVASPTVSTTYTITGTAVSGCTATAVAAVGVNAAPVVTLGLNSVGCAPLCVSFTSSSSTPAQSCQWNFGNGNGLAGCNTYYCYYVAGSYSISLTVTDFIGCVGTGTASATVYPVPDANFNATPQPTSILEPEIQFIDLTSNAVISSWSWDFGVQGLLSDTSRVQHPKYLYQDTGSYLVQLVVSTAYGCTDSIVRLVRINDDYELYVPSAFSPNADGVNEVFLPMMSGVQLDSYKFYVFDRWGNQVFESTELYKGWDGTYKGDVVMEDVYVWKIELRTTEGVKKRAQGHVSVLR